MRPLILVWALFIASAYMVRCDTRCPLHIIGHMANSIESAKWFLHDGANALEIDIQFEPYGAPVAAYHGVPCDFGRFCYHYTPIDHYMKEMRRLTDWDSKYFGALHFLMLDLKASSITYVPYPQAGYKLGKKIAEHLWNVSRARHAMPVILSVPAIKYIPIFDGVRKAIITTLGSEYLDVLGYAIDDFSEGAHNISSKFSSINIHDHRWVGTGITSTFPYWAETEEANLLFCRHHESCRCHVIDKAFHWTIDSKSSLRKAIQRGYDGVITNNPENAFAAAIELGIKIARGKEIWLSNCDQLRHHC